ncbi:MAG: hypothetical protein AAF628_24125 [Planctomycetota bacterium]
MFTGLDSILRRLGAAALLLLAGGCAAEREWRDVPLGDVAFEDAWDAVETAAAVDGFALNLASSDRGLRVLETNWRERAMPFRGSVRRRIHAEFDRGEAAGWNVRFYAEKQTVTDMAKGFEPEDEDWVEDGQDADLEERIAAKLMLKFHGSLSGAGQ